MTVRLRMLALAAALLAGGTAIARAACGDGFPVFESNTGQASDESIRFLSRSPDAILALTWRDALLIRPGRTAAVRMRVLGSRWRPRMLGVAAGRAAAVNCGGRATFDAVRYEDIYPGIDLVFHPGRGGFEFDFLLSAGAQPRPIEFTFDGVERMEVDALGNVLLRLEDGAGVLKLLRPTIYQEIGDDRRPVRGRYVLRGRRIGFEVRRYDARRALVIDPILVYAVHAAAAGEAAGVLRSEDGGATWIAGDLAGKNVRALAVDPIRPSVLYAGTEGAGVFRSSDGGRTWTSRSAGLGSPFVNALAIDPAAGAVLVAATTGGLYESRDGGSTWSAIGPRLPSPVYRSVAFGRPGAVYASADVWVARDAEDAPGWTFSTVSGDYVTSLAVDAADGGALYAGVFYATPRGGGVYKSVDGGTTWRLISAAVVSPAGRQYDINALAAAPWGEPALYAGTDGGGVFKTIDGGRTWRDASAGMGRVAVTALAVDPRRPSILYAAVAGRGVFKSADAGLTWTESTAGTGLRFPAALAIDPVMTDRVYVGARAATGAGDGAPEPVHLARRMR